MNPNTGEIKEFESTEAARVAGFTIPINPRNRIDWDMLRGVLSDYPPKARPRVIRWFARLANPKWIRGPFTRNRAMLRSAGERSQPAAKVWRPERSSKSFARWMNARAA